MTTSLEQNLMSLLNKFTALKNISRQEVVSFRTSSDSWGEGYATGQAAAYEDVIDDIRKALAKASKAPKAA